MKHMLMITALTCLFSGLLPAPTMAADCYADYKAKQDDPLRLHYGVAQVYGPCKKGAAKTEISSRLAPAGWTLLNVMSLFGPEGLQQRKADAGTYFLRF